MHTSSCSLCNLSRGIISRGEFWTMVLNANQTLIGRCYFSLNRHETDFTSLSRAEQSELFDSLASAKATLNQLFQPDHYNYVALMNIEPHVHVHIIPRYISARSFGGEQFVDGHFGEHYDPTQEKLIPDNLFEQLTDTINAIINP